MPQLYRDCIRLCTSVGILFYALAIDKLWDEQFRDTMSLGDFYALAGLTAVQFSMELNPSKYMYYNYTFIGMQIQCMWLILNKPGLDLSCTCAHQCSELVNCFEYRSNITLKSTKVQSKEILVLSITGCLRKESL